MLLIATFRPEFRSLSGADARIDLTRLSPLQVASMVEAIDSQRKLPTTTQHAPLALVFAHDLKATAQVYLGLATALSGDADAGIAHAQAALTYAEELRHPHSICYVLLFLGGPFLLPTIRMLPFR
jgi:hypothetical protein